MKLKAQIIPFSSIVGGGLALHNSSGRVVTQLVFLNLDLKGGGIHHSDYKEETRLLSAALFEKLNGMEISIE